MLSKATVLSLVCALCVATAAVAQGKGQGVEVRLVSPKVQEAAPGHILSLSFVVTNLTEQEEEFAEDLTLPAGWHNVIPMSTFGLRPREATTRLVSFQVPRDAPAGRHEIAYAVRSVRDYAIQDADTVTVVVLPVTKLGLLVEEKPESVIAGQSYEIRLRLVNQSNVELTVRLEVSSKEGYPARIEPAEATLAAGHTAPLVVTVQTDPHERRPHTHHVRVTARAVNGDEGDTTAAITVGVEIVPRITGEVDAYHRLPAELTLRVSGRDGDAAGQVEFSGAGTLDEEGTRAVEFLLRAPDTQHKGVLGRRDEYRLNYFTEDFGVYLGDQSYGLSRLTSYYRYGRGLGVDFHPPDKPTSLGAYYLGQRWGKPDRREAGLHAAQQVDDRVMVRFNFLRRHQDAYGARPGVDDTLWSLEANTKPREDMNVQAEYARGTRSQGSERRHDDAYRIEWDGRMGQGGYYRAARFHAGPDYHGQYRDSEHSYVSVIHPLGPRLRGSVSYNHYKSNLSPQPGDRSAPRETLWRAGASYHPGGGWRLSLDCDLFERSDRLPPAQFDYRERALRLGVGHSAREYSLRVETRAGAQEDHLLAQSRTAWNHNVFATYRPRHDAFFTAYAGFGDDAALRGSRLFRTSNNLGASVAWKPRPDVDLSLWYNRYNFDSADRPESRQYSARLRHRLPNAHEVQLEVRHNTRELWEDETRYSLVYAIPLSLPVSKKKTVGSIRGRVYDAEVPGRPGVAGAILRVNGATAVSNVRGEFIFPSVAPGPYQMTLDRASIGRDQVTEQDLPITLEVRAGEVTEVELGLVRGARVSGSVLIVAAEANGDAGGAVVVGDPRRSDGPQEARGLANVLVELVREQEVLRRVTDHGGRFLFENLRPGAWRLKVYDHNLPAYHYLETPEQDLALEPGETVEVTIRVLPRVRQIRFIDEGVIQPNRNNR